MCYTDTNTNYTSFEMGFHVEQYFCVQLLLVQGDHSAQLLHFVDFVLVIPLLARDCLGSCKSGRIGMSTDDNSGTPILMSTKNSLQAEWSPCTQFCSGSCKSGWIGVACGIQGWFLYPCLIKGFVSPTESLRPDRGQGVHRLVWLVQHRSLEVAQVRRRRRL